MTSCNEQQKVANIVILGIPPLEQEVNIRKQTKSYMPIYMKSYTKSILGRSDFSEENFSINLYSGKLQSPTS